MSGSAEALSPVPPGEVQTAWYGLGNGSTSPPPIEACPAGDLTVLGGGMHDIDVTGLSVVTKFQAKNLGAPGARLTFRIARPTYENGIPRWTTVGSVPATLDGAGTAEVPARIPVEGGDKIGISKAAGEKVACAWPIMDMPRAAVLTAPGLMPDGAASSMTGLLDHHLLVAAAVEPDADGDGFGDNSQDQCGGVPGPANGCVAAPATCKVPRVTGLRVDKAKERLTKAGCKAGGVKKQAGGPGTLVVKKQGVGAGKVVKAGTKVGLVVGVRS
jgi:hypothetical protein